MTNSCPSNTCSTPDGVPCFNNGSCICTQNTLIKGAYLPAITMCNQVLNDTLPYISTTTSTTSTTTTTTPDPANFATVTTNALDMLYTDNAHVTGVVEDGGSSAVTDYGFVWATHTNPTISDNLISVGSGSPAEFEDYPSGLPNGVRVYFRAYATNSSGTAYGVNLDGVPQYIPCLITGTQISLTNGTTKNIEDIDYNDDLLVWNFDEGKFDSAKPVWVAVAKTTNSHNILKFSDGTELKTVIPNLGHRIFNVEKGQFTYPMTEDTPIGTTTFTQDNKFVNLVYKDIVNEQANFYNILTDKHMNMFANTILTSSKLNNIYPTQDMKFVKDSRLPRNEFSQFPDSLVKGLRLSEQPESYSNEELTKKITDIIGSKKSV